MNIEEIKKLNWTSQGAKIVILTLLKEIESVIDRGAANSYYNVIMHLKDVYPEDSQNILLSLKIDQIEQPKKQGKSKSNVIVNNDIFNNKDADDESCVGCGITSGDTTQKQNSNVTTEKSLNSAESNKDIKKFFQRETLTIPEYKTNIISYMSNIYPDQEDLEELISEGMTWKISKLEDTVLSFLQKNIQN